MNCPRCTVALEWKQCKGTGVNCCPECQGLWLDHSALNMARQAGEADLPEDSGTLHVSKVSAISCPNDGAGLHTFTHRGVEVDACLECKGLWLDKGEWEKLAKASGSSTGLLTAGIGTVAAVGGAAALANASQSTYPYVGKNDDPTFADAVGDVVTEAAGGFFEGAFSLIADICSSIFD
jgi:Zn-finger nucleic acid-binding protein